MLQAKPASMSEPTVLRPTVSSLHTDQQQFHSFIEAIRTLLAEATTPLVAAENAAKVYLAVVTAFEQAGLVQTEHAPTFWLYDDDEHEYEVGAVACLLSSVETDLMLTRPDALSRSFSSSMTTTMATTITTTTAPTMAITTAHPSWRWKRPATCSSSPPTCAR